MPDFNKMFPVISGGNFDPAEARAAALDNWRPFKESVMRLNSREAAAVADKINKFYAGNPIRLPVMAAMVTRIHRIPALLDNFAYALMENERREPSIDVLKVKQVVDIVTGSTLYALDAISDKMAARIEFQPEALSMPKDAEGIYNKAFVDATKGSGRGFHWGCVTLRHAFRTPQASLLGADDALDLYADLRDIPYLVVDEFGEAGLDVADGMLRHLANVEKIPTYAM